MIKVGKVFRGIPILVYFSVKNVSDDLSPTKALLEEISEETGNNKLKNFTRTKWYPCRLKELEYKTLKSLTMV